MTALSVSGRPTASSRHSRSQTSKKYGVSPLSDLTTPSLCILALTVFLLIVCRHRALLRPPRPHSHGRGRRRSIWCSASFRMTFLFHFRCTLNRRCHRRLTAPDGSNPLDPRTKALGVNLSATSITKTHCKRPRNGTNPRASTRTPLLRHNHSHHHHRHLHRHNTTNRCAFAIRLGRG